ncbi:phosphotransferase [Pseudomonas sp. VS40]|nr:phosphotransferase [Pseudomonas sp. VS40]MBT1271897.1 phosphotransferase [Pseudomonas sp. VS59]
MKNVLSKKDPRYMNLGHLNGDSGLLSLLQESQFEVLHALNQADVLLHQCHLYKNGRSATVGMVEVNGRQLVIKRYNIKGFFHWLKRFWRPSRAWCSWREANRLSLLGIPTPKPLAVLEKRFFGLRGRAYLITEFLSGPDITERFAPYVKCGGVPENEILALEHLFGELIRFRISHGDLKGHNLLWDEDRWSLIDLDAMCQHRSLASFAPAFTRDRARFMRNWPVESELYKLIDSRLPVSPKSNAIHDTACSRKYNNYAHKFFIEEKNK